jgi:DNA-binding CsgD family transcriptional regulator
LAKRGGLILSGAGVTCADPRQAAKLAALIQCAAHGGPGGCTGISQGPKRAILAATASPLPVDDDASGAPLALLTLRDLGATSDVGEANLMELFGLTGAEAAIVPQLLAGDTMSLIAQSRGVSVATVRAQATRLLEKTGATNLRALASMIAALGCG